MKNSPRNFTRLYFFLYEKKKTPAHLKYLAKYSDALLIRLLKSSVAESYKCCLLKLFISIFLVFKCKCITNPTHSALERYDTTTPSRPRVAPTLMTSPEGEGRIYFRCPYFIYHIYLFILFFFQGKKWECDSHLCDVMNTGD